MISDKGSGSVGARADGRAQIGYDFDPHDVERIKAGMLRTAEVLLAGGAAEITAPVRGMALHRSIGSFADNLASKTIRDFGLYASHPMATCRMGRDPSTSVIDPYGMSHALPGLFIADASVFPTSLGVNPQLTTMAIATMLGRQMLSRGLPEATHIR
jgi:choline dehydrogenase-like flavoprotein